MADAKRYTDCQEVREDLSAYFDGELSAEDRAALDAHLRDCSECLRELNAYKRVDDAYRALPAAAAPGDFEAGVRGAVAAGKTVKFPERSPVPRWAGPLVAVAAAAVVVFGGVVFLEVQQQPAMEVASAPAETAMQKAEADVDLELRPAPSDGAGGAWDEFTANAPSADSSRPVAAEGAEESEVWRGFVGESSDRDASYMPSDDAGMTESEEGSGRADESVMRQRTAAASPAPTTAGPDAADALAEDRAAVIGQPPAGLSPLRAEALKDAANESERNESEANAILEDQANQARAEGEVLQRTVLRTFKVGADGAWYESGYDGQPTTQLVRGSDALRELMKNNPSFDWNRIIDRPARQIFEVAGGWYDLEAAPEV